MYIPVAGAYCPWSAWGDCTTADDCGYGSSERTRTCTCPTPFGSGAPCAGPATDTMDCYDGDCCDGTCGNERGKNIIQLAVDRDIIFPLFPGHADFDCSMPMYNNDPVTYTVSCSGNCANVAASITSNNGPMDMKITSTDEATEFCSVTGITSDCDGETWSN